MGKETPRRREIGRDKKGLLDMSRGYQRGRRDFVS